MNSIYDWLIDWFGLYLPSRSTVARAIKITTTIKKAICVYRNIQPTILLPILAVATPVLIEIEHFNYENCDCLISFADPKSQGK